MYSLMCIFWQPKNEVGRSSLICGVEEALHGLCGLNMSLLFLQASVDSSVNGVHLL